MTCRDGPGSMAPGMRGERKRAAVREMEGSLQQAAREGLSKRVRYGLEKG